MQKGMQKQQMQPKQQIPPATSIWKVLTLFWVVVWISSLQLGQFVHIGSGPAMGWAILIFRVYQTKFSVFSILKLNWDLEIEPSESMPQIEMTTLLNRLRFHEFLGNEMRILAFLENPTKFSVKAERLPSDHWHFPIFYATALSEY